MLFKSYLALSLALGLLSACAAVKVPDLSAYLPTASPPPMRWDARPEAASWTTKALAAVALHDGELANRVPGDIEAFCPGYQAASLTDRRAFWVGLMSSTAKHESSFNPKAVGGGGRYIGLMQISPRTASQYDCSATSGAALKDGAANLECAVRIFAPHVADDGQVAGAGNRGIARDWGPFHDSASRAEIASWTAAQSYCKA
jgi:hypothetical protein